MNNLKKLERKGIQSIETGFRIIDALVRLGQPSLLKEIAEAADMAPSNTHIYLVSLQQVGIAKQDKQTGRYALGPYAITLGLAGLAQFNLLDASSDILQNLAEEVGYTVFLGIWGNHGATVISRLDGRLSRTVFNLRVGSVLPLLTTALGRNFLAHLPKSFTRSRLEQELTDIRRLPHKPTDVPHSRREADAMCKQIRVQGASVCRSGLVSDLTAVSAPVFDHTGMMIAGVTVMGALGVMDDAVPGTVADAVITAAQQISANAGGAAKNFSTLVQQA